MRTSRWRLTIVVAVTLASTSFATQAFAQLTPWSNSRDAGSRSRDGHLTIFGAFALPLGDFGSTTANNGSFASAGAGIGLEFSARYSYGVETGIMVLADRQPVDGSALESALAARLRQYGFASAPLALSVGDWQLKWGLLKVGYAPQLSEHLEASVDVYGGALMCDYPDVNVLAAPAGLSFKGKQSQMGRAAGVGAGLRWRNHLKVGVLYLAGAAGSGWRESAFSITHQPISTLHATLGYAFGH